MCFKETVKLAVLTSLISASLSFSVMAADKALVIGVGKYLDERNNLPGIDLDIANFKRAIKRLGVKNENIKVLQDNQATTKNVRKVMKGWLSDVNADDKVFFYFSGHGSQMDDLNGDEEDNVDEFLVMHDFIPNKSGALTDDELGILLKGIPSENVYAFIDACHSGTATKGLSLLNRSLGENRGVSKFLKYKGMPVAKQITTRGIGIRANSDDNYAALSAAQDTELAIATAKGSIFTLGIDHAITTAITNNKSITPNYLIKEAISYVHKHTSSTNRFTPNLTGNENLFNKKIEIQVTASEGEYWQRLSQAADNNSSLNARSDKASYQLNDDIKFFVDIPKNGYLNVVTVDEQDNATVVFPNKFKPNNKVKKGKLPLDSRDSLGFGFYAMEPLGKSLTLFIVTEKPLNLYKKTTDGIDKNGNITAQLASLSANALKAIGVRQNIVGVWTGKVITSVTR